MIAWKQEEGYSTKSPLVSWAFVLLVPEGSFLCTDSINATVCTPKDSSTLKGIRSLAFFFFYVTIRTNIRLAIHSPHSRILIDAPCFRFIRILQFRAEHRQIVAEQHVHQHKEQYRHTYHPYYFVHATSTRMVHVITQTFLPLLAVVFFFLFFHIIFSFFTNLY